MDALNDFFDYLRGVAPGPDRDRSQALLLFATLVAQKPRQVLKMGFASGYLTLAALYALRANGAGTLSCLTPDTDAGAADRRCLLEQAGVRFVAGPLAPALDGLAPATFDCVVADAAFGACQLEALARVTAPQGMVLVMGGAAADREVAAMAEQARGLGHGCRVLGGASGGGGDGLVLVVFPGVGEGKGPKGHPGPKGRNPAGKPNQPNELNKPNEPNEPDQPLVLAMPPAADNFGWGLCSRYLEEELAKIAPVRRFDPAAVSQVDLRGATVFHALTGIDLEPLHPDCWGRRNVGYTFFENELTDRSVANARRFDLLLGGSSWCRDRMREKGIANCDVLIQGIDPRLFYPIAETKNTEHFVIFSGGKFELRKGQDIVLAAVKAVQAKYPDIVLVNCWYNIWPASMDTMAFSPHIRYERRGETWAEIMDHIYRINGLDPRRIFTIDLVPNATQRALYAQTDIGVFPNRCEGGTNLVLMEYMACAKPVIASNTSGHRDILSADNAVLLNQFSEMNIGDGEPFAARWPEPSVDELVAAIEWAYQHRDKAKALGQQAGRDLARFTWADSARRLAELLGAADGRAVDNGATGVGEQDKNLRLRWGLNRHNVGSVDLTGLAGHIDDAEYRGYFLDRQFREHYRLIAWLSTLFAGRMIFDIGTNRGCSALALAYNPANQVISYDIEDVRRLRPGANIANIAFHIGDVLTDARLGEAALIMLDTNHDGVFERQLIGHLRRIGFGGLLFFDDIHLNPAMESLWAQIAEPKVDITDLGHWSGSGLVDFSQG